MKLPLLCNLGRSLFVEENKPYYGARKATICVPFVSFAIKPRSGERARYFREVYIIFKTPLLSDPFKPNSRLSPRVFFDVRPPKPPKYSWLISVRFCFRQRQPRFNLRLYRGSVAGVIHIEARRKNRTICEFGALELRLKLIIIPQNNTLPSPQKYYNPKR